MTTGGYEGHHLAVLPLAWSHLRKRLAFLDCLVYSLGRTYCTAVQAGTGFLTYSWYLLSYRYLAGFLAYRELHPGRSGQRPRGCGSSSSDDCKVDRRSWRTRRVMMSSLQGLTQTNTAARCCWEARELMLNCLV